MVLKEFLDKIAVLIKGLSAEPIDAELAEQEFEEAENKIVRQEQILSPRTARLVLVDEFVSVFNATYDEQLDPIGWPTLKERFADNRSMFEGNLVKAIKETDGADFWLLPADALTGDTKRALERSARYFHDDPGHVGHSCVVDGETHFLAAPVGDLFAAAFSEQAYWDAKEEAIIESDEDAFAQTLEQLHSISEYKRPEGNETEGHAAVAIKPFHSLSSQDL